jgi:hypothetical protein
LILKGVNALNTGSAVVKRDETHCITLDTSKGGNLNNLNEKLLHIQNKGQTGCDKI